MGGIAATGDAKANAETFEDSVGGTEQQRGADLQEDGLERFVVLDASLAVIVALGSQVRPLSFEIASDSVPDCALIHCLIA
jgi:hypothetical protein